MSEQNQALIVRWFDQVWNNGNLDAIDEMFAADGQAHGFPEPDSVIDHATYKTAVAQFLTAFPGLRFTLEDTIAEGDKLAARWSLAMTHTGPGLGIAPTGTPIKMSGISIMHTRNGQITDAWNALDFTRVLHQLQATAAKA